MPKPTDPSNNKVPDVNSLAPDTIAERLTRVYEHPGPYVSLYLATRPLLGHAQIDTDRRWQALHEELRGKGASPEVLQAIHEHVSSPTPEDTAAIAVIAAADAMTVVDYGQEPPRNDVAIFDALPYVAPMLEWEQRRLAHIVVTVDDDGADVVTFGPRQFCRMDSVAGAPAELVEPVAALAQESGARLIVVSGIRAAARRLASDLALRVPFDCRIVAEPDIESVDELVEATVRHISDTVARRTVGYLRELRFLAAHDSAVDGTSDTLQALREASADVLLIHDDPDDDRRLWIGTDVHEFSLEMTPHLDKHVRLVDAVIRSALMTGVTVHIIPTTGPNGPDDNTAALQRTTPE